MPKADTSSGYSAEEMRMTSFPPEAMGRATRMTEEEMKPRSPPTPTNATWSSIGRRLSRIPRLLGCKTRSPAEPFCVPALTSLAFVPALLNRLSGPRENGERLEQGLNRRRLFPEQGSMPRTSSKLCVGDDCPRSRIVDRRAPRRHARARREAGSTSTRRAWRPETRRRAFGRRLAYWHPRPDRRARDAARSIRRSPTPWHPPLQARPSLLRSSR